MKVGGSGGPRGPSSVRRAGKTGSVGGDGFARKLADGEENGATASGVNAAAPLSGVSGVLAMQEVDDATARASKGKERALDMLDKLDDIKMGLLSGELSADRLVELARTVQARRAKVDDPRLAQVLDEIDLRAQVELAKLTPNRS